jgi:hypothetical protein
MNNQHITITESITYLEFDNRDGCGSHTINNNKCTIHKMKNYQIYNTLTNCFLDNLEYLELSVDYDVSIKGILPKKLKTLIFGTTFNISFEKDDLPQTLLNLTLGSGYTHRLINIPKSLVKLELVTDSEDVFNTIPPNVKILIIYANVIPIAKCSRLLNNLPIGLEKLIINCYDVKKSSLLNKIPFGCVVCNEKKELLCD